MIGNVGMAVFEVVDREMVADGDRDHRDWGDGHGMDGEKMAVDNNPMTAGLAESGSEDEGDGNTEDMVHCSGNDI